MRERLIYANADGRRVVFAAGETFHVDIPSGVRGLRDVDAEINMTTALGQDGATFESAYIQPRTITITGSIRTLDKRLQHTLMRDLNHVLSPKAGGTLTYEDGTVSRMIACHPETAPSYKGGSSWQGFTVGLVCPSPFWRAQTETVSRIAAWDALWEFPVELTDAWQIGLRRPEQIATVTNAGDVDSGMTIVFTALSANSNPRLLDVGTGEWMQINAEMLPGDVIEVTTGYGNKTATRYRGKSQTDVFRAIAIGSTFLQMRVGDNQYKLDVVNPMALDVAIRHADLYLGV